MTNVKFIKVGHFVDVFFGQMGWKPHTRLGIKRTPKGNMYKHISGANIPQDVLSYVIKEIEHAK